VSWGAARKAIAASEKYAGQPIELRPEDVLGLVPLGPNPETGYFEFYHLRSAWDGKSDPREIAIPTHGEDGAIELTDDTGIVFVLLPGGAVILGSQDEDESAPYYDAQRQSDEDLHPVTLSPFFLARHELTQGQWARLWSGADDLRQPSHNAAGGTLAGTQMTLAHPVEQVDWWMSRDMLASHGLALPTEAQWEYGCRGGTTTVWITPLEELQTVANLADATAKRAGAPWQGETWTDGHVVHAPVGSILANDFGLHDVHGNVWEWCLDAYSSYGSERVGDGLRPGGDGSYGRVYRGGGFNIPAVYARSAGRNSVAPTIRNGNLGLRPARTSRLRD
jgi:formylglycine-generating enzyme required for sulfatase activity